MSSKQAALRRNGKPQACEPCRKGKMRCDHAVPYCGRCVRRKMTARCVYHPAPMTKAKSPDTAPALEVLVPQPNHENEQNHMVPPYRQGCKSPSPKYIAGKAAAIAQSKRQSSLFKRSLASYGTTSFSATFSENQSRFGPELLDVSGDIEEPPQLVPKQKNTHSCLTTLRMIPSKETCDRLLNTLDSLHNPTIPHFMIREAVDSIWSTYASYLEEPKPMDTVMKMVDILYMNDRKPLRLFSPGSKETFTERLKSCTGPNLKWEMLGVVFASFGLAFMTLQDWDPLFQDLERKSKWDKDINRAKAAFKMKKGADACLKQCAATDTMNELVVCLMLNTTILESICVGDESFQVLRRSGDIMSTAMAIGLHRLPELPYVTAASEMQRALFAAAYFIDKSLSSLNGRPPLLSRHYCHFRMPLDLSYEALGGTQEQLDAEVARLDANGWNTDGLLHQRTVNRAFWSMALIREEILEISLGVNPVFSIDKINNLFTRLDDLISTFPPQIQFQLPGSSASSLTTTPITNPQPFAPLPTNSTPQGLPFYSRTILHLEFLQNHFLLNRLIHKHQPSANSSQALFNNALTILELVLSLWYKRDELLLFNSNFEWQIVQHGIPAAGVLCGKALKHARWEQSGAGDEEEDLDGEKAGIDPSTFPKSQVVRDLTMFIGFLDWVRPTDGNYMLCRRLRKVVQRIVDRVIVPRPVVEHNNGLGGGEPAALAGGALDAFVGGTGAGTAGEGSLLTPEEDRSLENGGVQGTALDGGSNLAIFGSGVGVGVGMGAGMSGMGGMAMMDSPPLDEVDCMDWINMVDWTQGPWVDFN